MTLELITRAVVLIAVLSTAVRLWHRRLLPLVLRPALASIDDDALVAVTGNVHRYGDRRMPVPGRSECRGRDERGTGDVRRALDPGRRGRHCVDPAASVWIVLYARVSAPINRQLTAAADARQSLANGRALQADWDRIIGARAMLQGLAVAALCVAR